MSDNQTVVYTVGHSNGGLETLIETLAGHDVARLVDVRRDPSSRRHPQFNRPALAAALAAAGIRYRHEEDLGGYRQPRPGTRSPNDGLDGPFQAYADHMATAAWRAAFARVRTGAAELATALLCAEVDPRRCHRRLIADALLDAGCTVVHLLGGAAVRRHVLHPLASRNGDGVLIYPAPVARQMRLF